MGAAQPPRSAPRGRLSDALSAGRTRGFVGRRPQLETFADVLAGATDARVLFVHGAGGMGKTTLLDAFARQAREAGCRPVYLDARGLEITGAAVDAALDDRAAREGYRSGEPPDVLLVDGYELLTPLDRWFREELLPTRPTESVTVIAGRHPPAPSWRLDAGWRRLVEVLPLGAMDAQESDALLRGFGLASHRRAALAGVGRGHPLVLAMLAEADREGSATDTLTGDPTIVAQLCRLLVDDVPDAAHRAGLATCAHATRMTADLLERIVGPRAEEVWAWLESRPYAGRGEVGLYLHDVVREVFDAELAHRSPDAYAAMHMTVRDYFVERLRDPAEPRPDRAAAQLLLLRRAGPHADLLADLRVGGLVPVGVAGPQDRDGILALVERAEGCEAAELARRWIAEQPACLYTARSDVGVEGFALHVYLPTHGPLDIDDPIAAGVLAAVAERGPLRPGERIGLNRFSGSSGHDAREPMILLTNGVATLLEWSRREAAWSFITTIADDVYGPLFEQMGLTAMWRGRRPPGPGGEVDEVDAVDEVVVYGWDRRRFPFVLLSDLMGRRELTGEQGPPPPEMVRPAPLERTVFAEGVAAALPLLHQPDRLAASPLVGTALVDPTAEDPVASLVATLVGAIGALDGDRRGAEHRRVLERTYLRGAPSQEAAAELLGLPFSTYRRHLKQARDRLVEVLWAIETGQTSSTDRPVG